MNINLDAIFPERPSDRDVNNLAIFLMELALEFEKKYSSQIGRYYKDLEIDMKNTSQ